MPVRRGDATGGVADALREAIARGAPVASCVGLQILFEEGEEAGGRRGSHRPGPDRAPPRGREAPHIGWSPLRLVGARPALFAPMDAAYVYFAHSYAAPADAPGSRSSRPTARPTALALARENLFAVQFHPEKSQQVGLALLSRFVAIRRPPCSSSPRSTSWTARPSGSRRATSRRRRSTRHPAEKAEEFARAGATLLHVVDLDGASPAGRVNLDAVRAICAVPGLEVELGGLGRCRTSRRCSRSACATWCSGLRRWSGSGSSSGQKFRGRCGPASTRGTAR